LLTQHIFNPVMPVVSKQALERVPPDLQRPFLEAAREAPRYHRSQAASTESNAFE
jgi:TRAP-type transport system periplasmic protein